MHAPIVVVAILTRPTLGAPACAILPGDGYAVFEGPSDVVLAGQSLRSQQRQAMRVYQAPEAADDLHIPCISSFCFARLPNPDL